MRTRSIPLLVAGALLAAGSASAAEAHLSLGEAVAEALDASPGLRALSSSTEAARREATAASRRRWGTVDAVAGYAWLQDDVVVRPISRQLLEAGFASLPFATPQWRYGVVAELPLYLGGRLSSGIRIAQLEADKAGALLEGTRWQVRFNVTSLYTAAQRLDAVGRALDNQITALESTAARLDLMVAEGKRPEVDRLKVVEELEGARARRAAVESDRTRVGALLLSLLGRDPASGLGVDPLPEHLPALVAPPEGLRADLDGVSAVRHARLALEQARSGVKVATSEYLPKLVAHGDYMINDGSGLPDTQNTWSVSVGVVLPLLHGGARGEHRAAAQEREQAAAHALEKARLDAAARLEDALGGLRAARQAVVAARARVEAGTEVARIEKIRYDAGASTIEDLLRAQAREAEAEAALAGARAGVITAAAHVDSIVEKEATS
jgi:outer membrane protein TolC